MKHDCLAFTLTFQTLSPVHIGDGGFYDKRSYILKDDKAYVFEGQALYSLLEEKKLLTQYENMLMSSGPSQRNNSLINLFRENRLAEDYYLSKSSKYIEVLNKDSSPFGKDIFTLIRDPYGNPYIPGTSIKGAIRNSICSAISLSDSELSSKYNLKKRVQNASKADREYMGKDSRALDRTVFQADLFENDDSHSNEMKNDIMRGIVVSDSESLTNNDVCICKVLKITPDGFVYDNPRQQIFVECLKPGVTFKVNITVDISDRFVSKLSKSQSEFCLYPGILNAIKINGKHYREEILSHFPKIVQEEPNNSYHICFGRYTGFASKTEVYSLLSSDEARNVSAMILGDRNKRSIYPSMLSCVKHDNKFKHMGECILKASKIDPRTKP